MLVERDCIPLHLGNTFILASGHSGGVQLKFQFAELLALLIGSVNLLEFALESVLVLELIDFDPFDATVVTMQLLLTVGVVAVDLLLQLLFLVLVELGVELRPDVE